MQSTLYVSLSGQIALQKRMETIANNVANLSTTGYRAEEVRFESIISDLSREPTAFASRGETYLSRQSGGFTQTENRLDVAIKGDAFLAIGTPAGQVYTRDGRFKMSPEGELQTLNGHQVLDAGGAPIQLNPAGGDITIAGDGAISQGDQQVGTLGLFTIPQNANLRRYENSGVIPDVAAEPALDFSKVGVAQGFIEQANVNPVSEITKMIMVSRNFEAITNAIKQSDSQQSESIRALGPQ
jgi:flagellar basal-body rod protein FlgF